MKNVVLLFSVTYARYSPQDTKKGQQTCLNSCQICAMFNECWSLKQELPGRVEEMLRGIFSIDRSAEWSEYIWIYLNDLNVVDITFQHKLFTNIPAGAPEKWTDPQILAEKHCTWHKSKGSRRDSPFLSLGHQNEPRSPNKRNQLKHMAWTHLVNTWNE